MWRLQGCRPMSTKLPVAHSNSTPNWHFDPAPLRRIKSACLCLVLLLAVNVACSPLSPGNSAGFDKGIEIRGLRIQNQSFRLITQVSLLVTRTGEFISCGNIPINGECSTTFPLRQYQGNQIEIKWKQGSEEWSSGEFVVDPSDSIDQSRPAMVRVIITTQGLAITELVQ